MKRRRNTMISTQLNKKHKHLKIQKNQAVTENKWQRMTYFEVNFKTLKERIKIIELAEIDI